MKKILITGGAGFIGANLSEYLLKRNYNITVLDDLSVGKKEYLKNNKIKFFKADINNINSLNFKDQFDILIHLAAKAEILISKKKEIIYQKSNLSALQSALNFSARNNIKKFIFSSSASVYGNTKNKKVSETEKLNPEHYYAYTKFIGEKMITNYCKINNINYTIFRFFNVYGKFSNAVIGKFISQHLQNKKFTIYGDGKQKRDFVHIHDVNNVIYKSLKSKKSENKIYNLGAGSSISIIKLKNIISSKNGYIFLDKRNDDIEISMSNIQKLKKDFNWMPKIGIEKGIKNMLLSDKKRLKKKKFPSIKIQKKLIKEFNSNI